MKIGISIPESLHSPDQLFEWVRRVDQGPFSTLSILDRVVYSNYEPLMTLATAAALSTRVRVREDDFIATGADYKGRGKHIEEQISQMRHIWSGQAWNDNVGPIGPAPVQTNGPEIILGGFVPRAMQRAARYADGFITALNDYEQIGTTFRSVEQCWKEAKRSGKP